MRVFQCAECRADYAVIELTAPAGLRRAHGVGEGVATMKTELLAATLDVGIDLPLRARLH